MAKRRRPAKSSPEAEGVSDVPSPAAANMLGLTTTDPLPQAAARLTLAASRPEDFFQADESIAQVSAH